MARIAALLLACSLAVPAAAQQETLGDIRQDLAVLNTQFQRLKTELSTTGVPSIQQGGSTLDRLTTIEAELQRLTGQTEQLEFRIEQVVQDGTNRVGDLNFRLCELEPDCDIGAIGQTPRIGGGQDTGAIAPPQTPTVQVPTNGPELAVSERSDFERAQQALDAGDYQAAVEQFGAFRTTYPGSPLDPQVLMGQGTALESLGDTREAARAYLAVFSGYPDADNAPEALARLGIALGALGKTPEACVTLSEVSARYPGSAAVEQARDAMTGLGCS